jgi:hypothetical protein
MHTPCLHPPLYTPATHPPHTRATHQDLEFGDLVVTNDFKGSGCWTAQPDPAAEPFLRLRKNGHDGAGECRGAGGWWGWGKGEAV